MGQPVKVSSRLILDARLMGEVSRRSIAGQIEFWARLGCAVESLLRGDQVLALCKVGKAKSLSACLNSVDSSSGRKRLVNYLNSLPYPHYEPVPGSAQLLVKIDANGKRTTGKFLKRKFQAVSGSGT